MTFLASLPEVGLHDAGVRSDRVGYIVAAVAVGADGYRFDRLVFLLSLQFIKFQGNAMKIREIRIHDSRRKSVFSYNFPVRVTVAADVRNTLPVVQRGRIFDGMGGMTISADRDVLVVFVEQGVSMDTFRVDIVNAGMATLAPFGNERPFLADMGNAVRAVAVDADRSAQIALAQHGIVNTLHGLCIFVKMAAPAIL